MRALIVDDHPMVRQMLEGVVRSVFDEAIVLMAGSLGEALEQAGAEAPGLVLLDLGLPDCAGIDTLKRFRKAHPGARVIVVSASDDRDCVVRALDEGAAGYVPKGHSPALIAAALRVVEAGGTYVPPQAVGEAAGPAAARDLGLTDRQLAVMRLIAKGLPNKEIAHRLKISEDTVKYHATNAYHVLGVDSRAQAMTLMARRGIRFD